MDTMGEKTGPQKITAKSLSEFHFTKKKSREKLIFSSLTGRMEESIKLTTSQGSLNPFTGLLY